MSSDLDATSGKIHVSDRIPTLVEHVRYAYREARAANEQGHEINDIHAVM